MPDDLTPSPAEQLDAERKAVRTRSAELDTQLTAPSPAREIVKTSRVDRILATRAASKAAADARAVVDAELDAFAGADELTRIEKWQPERRAALATMLRQRAGGSPI